MKTIHVVIHGIVQGVGYRAFVAAEAQARGLSGWVRNRRVGTVEAVLAGSDEAIEAMLAACRSGPSMARVDGIDIDDWNKPAEPGFTVLPTV